MELDVEIDKTELAPEGVHAAVVEAIQATGDKKCVIQFKMEAEGSSYILAKSYPAELVPKSPLSRDVQLVLGRHFNTEDTKQKFKLESIIGRSCRILVQHKRGRGKMKASVETVLEAEKDKLPGVTGEAVEKKEASAA